MSRRQLPNASPCRENAPVSRIAIVVPCFDEERRLNTAAFEAYHDADFYFVNDGSRDGTLAVLQSLAATDPSRLHVLDLAKNGGKAEAVRLGMLAAIGQADYVGFWDADLATPLEELQRFVEVLDNRDGVQMVFGARVRLLGRQIGRRASRHYFGRIGATLISASLGLAVYDTQCGAKLFRSSELLREIFAKPFLSRWIFDVEIIARLVQHVGHAEAVRALYELPLLVWHDVDGSKVKGRDYFRGLRDLWKIHRAYNAR